MSSARRYGQTGGQALIGRKPIGSGEGKPHFDYQMKTRPQGPTSTHLRCWQRAPEGDGVAVRVPPRSDSRMQNGRLTIRRASSADAQSIAFVHVTSWREAHSGLMPDHVLAGLSIEERTSRWQAILAGETGTRSWEYLAEVDGTVVGFGSCGPQRDRTSSGMPLPAKCWRCTS